MTGILGRFGRDLARDVLENNLPVVDLDIDNPVARGYRFLDFVLLTLMRAMNSTFFIGEDVDYLHKYINALSLLLEQPDTLASRIRLAGKPLSDDVIERAIKRLANKRIYILDILELLDFTENKNELWDSAFGDLMKDVQEKNCFLAIRNIHHLFRPTEKGFFTYPGLSVFFATQGKVRLTFIAPLSWNDYVNDIERGLPTRLIQFRTPILFSPRPAHLQPPPQFEFTPDKNFSFETKPNPQLS